MLLHHQSSYTKKHPHEVHEKNRKREWNVHSWLLYNHLINNIYVVCRNASCHKVHSDAPHTLTLDSHVIII